MTTEYHDEVEDDSSSFWNKEPRPVSFSAVSRVRRWLYPGLGAAFVLIFIIAVGITNTSTLSRLWSVEKALSNQTEWLMSAQQLAKDAAKDAQRLKFSVESNKEQLTSVSEGLKQLSTLDTIGRTVAKLKCSLERFINNGSGSVSDGCCPLGWEAFGSSCYLFSRTVLSWHEARDWCNGHESHLVILMSDEEWDFVTRLSAGSFYWVGLTDEKSGRWEWVNQTPYVMNRRYNLESSITWTYAHWRRERVCRGRCTAGGAALQGALHCRGRCTAGGAKTMWGHFSPLNCRLCRIYLAALIYPASNRMYSGQLICCGGRQNTCKHNGAPCWPRRWRPGQPDSWTSHGLGPGDEDCAHIHNDGRLNDLHCSSRLRYICQRHSQRS